MINISVVIPVFSGELFLETVALQLSELKSKWERSEIPLALVEVVFVDDSAIDNSGSIIDKLCLDYNFVKSLHLSRNFGQHAATMAGILHTQGDWVATIDEDLQHSPSKIEDLLRSAVSTSSDIIYANAIEAVHQNLFRDLASRAYKKLIHRLSGNPNVQYFNSFRLIRGSVARAAAVACSHSTYFDVALSWFTQRIDVVQLNLKDERHIQTGKSGYSFYNLLSHARRMLVSSQVKALRFGSVGGLTIFATSFLIGVLLILNKLIAPQSVKTDGWTSLMLVILFLGGATVFLLGIVIEYLSVLMLESHGKPVFFFVDRNSDDELKEYYARAK
jgi:polyisoprenyl-phosphate glycosyltransferase